MEKINICFGKLCMWSALDWNQKIIRSQTCWRDPRRELTSTKVYGNKLKWGSILKSIGNRRSSSLNLHTMTLLFKLPMWDFITYVWYSQESPIHTWVSSTPHQRTNSPLSESLTKVSSHYQELIHAIEPRCNIRITAQSTPVCHFTKLIHGVHNATPLSHSRTHHRL